jgi:hypothetical protein
MTDNITLPRAVTDRDAMKLALRALDTLSAYTLVSHEGSIYAQARKTLRAALAEPSLKVSVDPTAFTASAFSQAAVLEQAEAFETAYQTKSAALNAALAEQEQKQKPATDEQVHKWYWDNNLWGLRHAEFRYGWRAAERFHGIRKEDGK